MAEHPTVVVEIEGEMVPVDVDVAPLVVALNEVGFPTVTSCQEMEGAFWAAGEAYVELGRLTRKDRERLLEAIEKTFKRLNSENYPAFSTCHMGIRDEIMGIYAVHPHYVDQQTFLTCSCYNAKGNLEAARARRRETLVELARTLRGGR